MINYTEIPSPCFVIEEKKLRKNLETIRKIGDRAEVEFILAFKGFAMWKTFRIVGEYIKGASASSLYEAKLANEEMRCQSHTYSPVYRDDEIKEIVDLSSHITFNSLSQFEKHLPFIRGYKPSISVGLRVNPGFSPVKTELYNPTAPGSRLGVVHVHLSDRLPEGIEGLHFHALCENTSYEFEKVLNKFIKKYEKYFDQIKWVNFGGGHLVTHKDYDKNHLVKILKAFKKKYNLHVILEPGSAFAWETGTLVSTVLDIVENNGIKTAIVDVSFTAHMPDCLEMPYKPGIVGATDEIKGKPTYRIGGISCLAGDYIGNWSFDKALKPGDKIIFEDMMHYTMVKTTMFNGVLHPSIGMWRSNNRFELFKKFSYYDYRGRLS